MKATWVEDSSANAQAQHLSGWALGPWGAAVPGLHHAPLTYVVVLTVVCDSKQGAVVALRASRPVGISNSCSCCSSAMALASARLPGEPARFFAPHSALDWLLCLPSLSLLFGFLFVRDPNLLAWGRHAHTGTEVSPHSLSLCHSVACPEEGGKWGGQPPNPSSRGSQGWGGCDCCLGLERKLRRGLGWETGGRGWPALGGGDGFSTHGRGGKGRGWGLPWEARDESPRDRGLEGGEDMEAGRCWGPMGGGATAMENSQI